jgi:hypothetical protein
MNLISPVRLLGIAATFVFLSMPALAGPPFQTDDPEPIDFRHFEFYTFGSSDGTGLETDTISPGFEFNWGALPNVHLHIIVPAAAIFPAHDPRAYGIGDVELGIKLRFIQETKHRPMIGTFTMFEMPSGDASRGLGLGRTWYKVPLWAQKSFGEWTTYGGGGVTVVNTPGFRNYPFAGWLVQRDLGKVTLGTEVFYHGPEGPVAPQTRPATMVDVGGYYKFRDPGFQLLFCYGHTVVGQTENYGYLGLYWTWGKDDKDKDSPDKGGGAKDPSQPAGLAFNRIGPPGLMGHS